MEPLAILYADNLDLLFEHRNKLYGAYPLRKYYAKRLITAIAIVFGFVFILASLLIIFRDRSTFSGRIVDIPDIAFLPVNPYLPTVVKPLTIHPPAALKKVAVAVYTDPLIVKELPDKPMASIVELKSAVIGIRNEEGPAATGDPAEGQGLNGGTTATKKDSVETAPKILDRAEIMPEFPGGQEALRRYLARNLRMPDAQAEPGSQVRVIVKFVVGPDGKVTGISTIQSGGSPFDREVQRVIFKMPTWKPGMQNGRKVSVYYVLPVSFVIPAGD